MSYEYFPSPFVYYIKNLAHPQNGMILVATGSSSAYNRMVFIKGNFMCKKVIRDAVFESHSYSDAAGQDGPCPQFNF
jgi:hypothetical protein